MLEMANCECTTAYTYATIKIFSKCLSVMALKGKISSQLGAKEYHEVTEHNRPYTRHLLGKTQEGLCLGKEQPRTEQEADFI